MAEPVSPKNSQSDESSAALRTARAERGCPCDAPESCALATALIDTANAIVVGLDSSGNIVEFNPAAEAITGYSRAELAGRDWFEVICPRERYPEVWAEFARLASRGMPRTFENPILTKSGEERLIVWSNGEWQGEDGAVSTISFGIDVTEQRKADRALAESVALLSSLIEGIPDAVFAKNLDGRYVLINSTASRVLGKSKEEALGKDDKALFSAQDAKVFMDGDQRVIETGEPLYYEEHVPTDDGTWRYRLSSKGPIRDERGELIGVFGVTRDTTESKAAEQALAQAAHESGQLATASMALVGCRSEDEVFAVVIDFFAAVAPGSVTIVNQATEDGEYFVTRSVRGLEESVLAKAAKVVGFEFVGQAFLVTDEYRGQFSTMTLTQVPGGFAELAASEVPTALGKVIEKMFGFRDAYTVGIADPHTEFGSVHILTRVPGEQLPAHIIDPFVQQCFLAISALRRAADVAKSVEVLAQSLSSVIDVVSRTVEMRDPYTAGHQRRVSALAARIADRIGMSEAEIEDIRVAGLVHDVGKVSIPAEILSRPGSLAPAEFALVRTHAEAGYEIIRSAHMREPIAELVCQHHERCDGSGYPHGVVAADLLPGAKVLMVADVVEAMASHRPYRPALGVDAAIEEIERNAGVLYDAEIVDACVALLRGGFDFEVDAP